MIFRNSSMLWPILALAVVVAFSAGGTARAATEAEIDQAIQDGLAWLATTQNPNGSFGSGYILANTATAVLAFENEGHFPGGGSLYSVAVEDGLDFAFNYCRLIGINVQTYGDPGRSDDPDTNGNGAGVYFSYMSSMYETGIVMQAIAASNTPTRIVTTGPCAGMSYHEVMTDLVDFLAWAQADGSYGRGGWRYGIYNNSAGYSDNSVAQWPVLGLVAAEQWGIHAPDFVKSELEYWVTYIQHSSGGSGYHVPNDWYWTPNASRTGGLLVEFAYLGDDYLTSARAQNAADYLDTRWNLAYSGWYGNKGHPYAMFSVFKGLELMDVATIPSAPSNPESSAGDWWGDYAEYLVDDQNLDGSWNGYSYWGPHLATPWYIVILQASVFPVTVDVSVPDSACDLTGYDVNVSYSVERFSADGTLTVYRDGDVFDTVVLTDFIGSDSIGYTVAPETLGTHVWKAVLEVTGSGITTTAEDLDGGEVFETPQVSDIPDQMAPFATFDLDDYVTCSCASVDWTVTGVPADWTVDIDSNHLVTVTAPADAVAPVALTFSATFHWPTIDCTDSDTATFTPNQPPVAHPGKIYPEEKYYVVEGGTVPLDGTQSYDPDGDSISFAWDLDGDTVFETSGPTPVFSAAGLDNPPTDEVYIYLQVTDEHGAWDIGLAEVVILDAAPTADFSWAPEPQSEGSAVVFTDLSTSPVDDITAWSWDFAGFGSSGDQSPTFTFLDNGPFNVCLTVTDDDGSTATACHSVSILNVAPAVGAITGPTDPVAIDTPISISAPFADPGLLDTHSAVCVWDDGAADTIDPATSPVTCSHTYTEAGIYTVAIEVVDDNGGVGISTLEYIVVYDPSAGFVSGCGWIWSPLGAYRADQSLEGMATFGFVSKYVKRGATVPEGETHFQFHAGDLFFRSDTYSWLVISGFKATYRGVGTINGEGSYEFVLSAIDSELAQPESTYDDFDRFRIKIWDANGIVYDNQYGEPDDADPTTVLGSGSIIIHDNTRRGR